MSFSAKFLFKIFFPPLIFLLGALSLRLGALYVFYIFQILVYCRIFVCVFFCTCFFVFFWLCWVGTSYGTRALRFCARASLSCSMWAPEHVTSVVVAGGLSWPVARGISVPWPRIQPVSSAWEARFVTTGSPRKSHCWIFEFWCFLYTFCFPLFYRWANRSQRG